MIKRVLYGTLIVFVISCKTHKKAVERPAAVATLSASKVIEAHYRKSFQEKTLKASLRVAYESGKTSKKFRATLRIKKDEVIWIRISVLGFPLAKAMITPGRVRYYEGIKKTFFDGDFSVLSDWLGFRLNFDMLQNILLGQALTDIRNTPCAISIDENSYHLEPKNQISPLQSSFWIDPQHFKINHQKAATSRHFLQAVYENYITVGDETLPENILIKAVEKGNTTTIAMEYTHIKTGKSIHFPFAIPEGYKEIKMR